MSKSPKKQPQQRTEQPCEIIEQALCGTLAQLVDTPALRTLSEAAYVDAVLEALDLLSEGYKMREQELAGDDDGEGEEEP